MDHQHILQSAVAQLNALAQETRLGVFLLLIRAGQSGMMQGELAREMSVPPQTLSFHLKQLAVARLVRTRRAGTAIFYSADFEEAQRLSKFFTENCCAGRAPIKSRQRKRFRKNR